MEPPDNKLKYKGRIIEKFRILNKFTKINEMKEKVKNQEEKKLWKIGGNGDKNYHSGI